HRALARPGLDLPARQDRRRDDLPAAAVSDRDPADGHRLRPREHPRPGIFPTTVPTSSGPKKLKQPYSRALGRQDPTNPVASERRGIIQLQGRAIAHLLGHALGLSGDGAVANDPAFSAPPPGDYWPPDPYPGGTGSFTYADSLHTTSDGGDHLTFS